MVDGILRKAPGALAFAALTLLPSQASAAIYVFTLSGNASATFNVDSNPIPQSVFPDFFTVVPPACTYNRSPTTCGLTFYTTAQQGGLDLAPTGFTTLNLVGAQLFTGTTATPTFTLGTYPLSTLGSEDHLYSLTISLFGAPVPEPSTWAMLVLGFAGIGFVVSRRAASVA